MMNKKGSVIPVIAETLDLMPEWLKITLFLAVVFALSIGLWWAGPIKAGLNSILDAVCGVFNIGYCSWDIFVIVIFIAVLALVAWRANR